MITLTSSYRTSPGETSLQPRIDRKTWTSVVSHLDPKYGGLSAAVPALGSSVAKFGSYSVNIAAFCHSHEQFSPSVDPDVTVSYHIAGRLARLKKSAVHEEFRNLINGSEGIHIHGIWEQSTLISASYARRLRKPYIVSAHGMLEKWAVSNKRFKKAVYAALFERRNLQTATCLHALTEAEVTDYRRFGLRNPVAVIPNGVDIPPQSSRATFLETFPDLQGKRLVLFLGRIHFKKGLDLLCEAWREIGRKWPEAHLVLAGPDFEDTRSKLEGVLCGSEIRRQITFTGMLRGEMKWSALAASDFFVLPSYSEGLSVSVLEAMGMHLPVVITKQCNIPEVEELGCGLVIQPNVEELEAGLNHLLSAKSSELSAMGERGRDLVIQRYSWPVIGQQMSELYEWTAGGKEPRSVDIHQ